MLVAEITVALEVIGVKVILVIVAVAVDEVDKLTL